MVRNFQDLCEVKDIDNIVLKYYIPTLTSIDVQYNGDWLNNLLGNIFYRVHTAKDERPDLKDYKLSKIILGKQVFDSVKEYFNIESTLDFIRIFDIFTKVEVGNTDSIEFKYSWTIFEIGNEGVNNV